MTALNAPITAGWFFTSHQQYSPTRLNAEESLNYATSIISKDRELIGMVQRRGLPVCVAVVVGKNNLTATFFDAEPRDVSVNAVLAEAYANAVLLLIDTDGSVTPAIGKHRDIIVSSPVLARAVRVLTAVEKTDMVCRETFEM